MNQIMITSKTNYSLFYSILFCYQAPSNQPGCRAKEQSKALSSRMYDLVYHTIQSLYCTICQKKVYRNRWAPIGEYPLASRTGILLALHCVRSSLNCFFSSSLFPKTCGCSSIQFRFITIRIFLLTARSDVCVDGNGRFIHPTSCVFIGLFASSA